MQSRDLNDTPSLCKYAISLIDHTSLNTDDTTEVIDELIRQSLLGTTKPAAICVYPKFVKYIKTKYPEVRVATVVNFPSGTGSTEEVVSSTKRARVDGADEIDLVINYQAILKDEVTGLNTASLLIKSVRRECPEPQIILKVIIESGELKLPKLISAASICALDAGANFVKTSTGKVPINSTIEAASVILNAIKGWKSEHPDCKRVVGFKAAGSVKTVEQTKEYIHLAEIIMGRGWVTPQTFRFGASSLLKVLRMAALENCSNIDSVEATTVSHY